MGNFSFLIIPQNLNINLNNETKSLALFNYNQIKEPVLDIGDQFRKSSSENPFFKLKFRSFRTTLCTKVYIYKPLHRTGTDIIY